MWIKEGTRSDLLDLIKHRRRPLSSDQVMERDEKEGLPSKSSELQFVWAVNPTAHAAFPSAVIIDERTRREFFAWTSTYLSNFRPLTAYCRVTDTNTANIFLQRVASPMLGDLENACLGLILCEAMAY